MGDPKKTRKKYATPSHPWQKERIEEENAIIKEYGMKNKKEIWKMRSFLQNAKHQAKRIVALKDSQAEKEKALLLGKLMRYGLLKENSSLDDVLGLSLKDVLERRLQTLTKKHGHAKTMNQARQFIVHAHVTVRGKTVTSPSYLVSVEEEPMISFSGISSLANTDHPERSFSSQDAKTLSEIKKSKEKKKEEAEVAK